MVSRPKGYRQTKEGYWLGTLPGLPEIPFIQGSGIKVVLSAVKVSEAFVEALRGIGVRQVDAHMGCTFRHGERILDETKGIPPHGVLLHCQHGADRTGCMAAFLLCIRCGWNIPDAFYSVLYRSSKDATALAELLSSEFGIEDRRYSDDERVGFYSHAACGVPGGLKARSSNYQRLISTTIKSIQDASRKRGEGE